MIISPLYVWTLLHGMVSDGWTGTKPNSPILNCGYLKNKLDSVHLAKAIIEILRLVRTRPRSFMKLVTFYVQGVYSHYLRCSTIDKSVV